MAFFYTKEQRKVIDTKNSDILVSAAAGSGKTAVLVERIIRILTQEDIPVSVDELLIVTFTNLAATEMRERIQKAIEARIDEEQDEKIVRHLMKQIALMPTANIMTLHSYCLKLLRSYYHKVDLDPTFRIANETELILLQEEVLEELFEAEYEKERPEFIELIEKFSYQKNDHALKEMIVKIATMARSYPWPQEWLHKSVERTDFTSVESLYRSSFFQVIHKRMETELKKCDSVFLEIEDLMNAPEGPDKYQDTVAALKQMMSEVEMALQVENYGKIGILLQTPVPELSRKSKGYDKELASQAKERIDTVKSTINTLREFVINEKKFPEESKNIHQSIKELVNVTCLYLERIRTAKKDKNLIDFSDIEHFTLELLYENKEYTETASLLKEQFYEVLVDEYQDINEVQEAILLGFAKREVPNNNLFMVGDLKQSIYRFRLAKPEIFREKYRSFAYEEGKQIKIDLAKNFRSRKAVLDFSNDIFEKVMSEEIGDVDYNEMTKLYYGSMDYDPDTLLYRPEIRIIEQSLKEYEFDIQGVDVANRIKELMADENFFVQDKNEGKRRLKYGDICILMRSPGSILTEIKNTFDRMGIPYASESSGGFFEALEIQLILSYLKIIDNPYQEIPLAAILRAPFISCNENELLALRTLYPNIELYDAVVRYIEMEEFDVEVRKTSELKEKLRRFIDQFGILRREALLRPIHELIERMYTLTGYKYYVSFMENGEQRKINLEYLLTQARRFSESSYKGLFNFIRYMKHVEKYEVDIPEPLYQYESKSQVQLMSIHKSKGLEFPVVFLIQVHKQFNKTDLRQGYVLHQDLGIACDFVDPKLRIRKESLIGKAIKLKAEQELLSEEIRLLYVALTRAREKLIVIGKVKDLEKCRNLQGKCAGYSKKIPSESVEAAKSYLDLFLMCFCEGESSLHQLSYIRSDEIDQVYALDMLEQREESLLLEDLMEKGEALRGTGDYQDKKLRFHTYPYEKQASTYANLSVSELKRFAQLIGDPETQDLQQELQEAFYKTRQMEKRVPKFISKVEPTYRGSHYGVLIHTILARLPFEEVNDQMQMENYLDSLLRARVITKEERETVSWNTIFGFTCSPLYQRMRAAYNKGQLYREKPFVHTIETDGDFRMVQGIIDAYFYEEDEKGDRKIILLDYKTDQIKADQESLLKERYGVQLYYYQKALEESTGCKVKESYIYSLAIQKEIRL